MTNVNECIEGQPGYIGQRYREDCANIECQYVDGPDCPVLRYFQIGLRPRVQIDQTGKPVIDNNGNEMLIMPSVEQSKSETNIEFPEIPMDCSWDLSA